MCDCCFQLLVAQRDSSHYTIYKKRRCFLWNNQYFQMDIYQEPCHPRCRGLIILETHTTHKGDDLKLPDFLEVVKEVTDDKDYSMYALSKRDMSESDQQQLMERERQRLEDVTKQDPEVRELTNPKGCMNGSL